MPHRKQVVSCRRKTTRKMNPWQHHRTTMILTQYGKDGRLPRLPTTPHYSFHFPIKLLYSAAAKIHLERPKLHYSLLRETLHQRFWVASEVAHVDVTFAPSFAPLGFSQTFSETSCSDLLTYRGPFLGFQNVMNRPVDACDILRPKSSTFYHLGSAMLWQASGPTLLFGFSR